MKKIPIKKISSLCHSKKGFDARGCYGCACTDLCCQYGADFDAESHALVVKHRKLIESMIGRKIESCFSKGWSNETEYLGGNMIRCNTGPDGFCSFHNPKGKGCVLYMLTNKRKISRRIVPSICRIFPLTWDGGKLMFYEEDGGYKLPRSCNCVEAENKTCENVLQSRKEEFEDIFEFAKKRPKQ